MQVRIFSPLLALFILTGRGFGFSIRTLKNRATDRSHDGIGTSNLGSPSTESQRRLVWPHYATSLDPTTNEYRKPETVFSEQELCVVQDLYNKCSAVSDDAQAKKVVADALPSLSPMILVKLRQQQQTDNGIAVQTVSRLINSLLDERMELAKETLSSLLEAGEIRKLDALIGKAAQKGNLDVAFFNVLTVNLQDAAKKEKLPSDNDDDKAASRLQILQHIFTRCQEEVEKTIPPGKALVNKLIRTPEPPIRRNLYEHYLAPKKNTISSPDGKVIELQGSTQPLLPLHDFISAIDDAVLQIRNVESTGAVDRESGAMMVESCRAIAKEARIVIGEAFGRESDEIQQLQDGLEPVFRPTSPDSPYIQGNYTKSE